MAELHQQFKCSNCGGNLEYHPGEDSQKCPFCGDINKIPQSEDDIKELDFHAFLSEVSQSEETQELSVVDCEACGAKTTLDPNISSDECPYCGSSLIIQGGSVNELKPKSLLPFKVTKKEARDKFKIWIKGLWFAPSKLKSYARVKGKLSGLYVPYWTYDCDTTSYYRGKRGDDYWVTETYTTTENGKSVTKTRQVRKTRWRSVSGVVWDNFDDLLILASRSLPKKYADKLKPWDLQNLEPYQEEFIGGFRTESYQVDLEEGFGEAKGIMDDDIKASVRRDIGGDHQRIHSIRSQYENITFKHILLPIWLSAYRYDDKVYRFLVNARTGEIQGERPWSWIKITLAILGVAALIAGIVYFYTSSNTTNF